MEQEEDKIVERYTRADRDLLIKVNTKLDILIEDFGKSIGDISTRVTVLEKAKAEEKEIERIYDTRIPKWAEFDKRISSIEKLCICENEYKEDMGKVNSRLSSLEGWKKYVAGAAGLLGIVIGLVSYIYLSSISHLEKSIDEHITETKTLLRDNGIK